MVAKQSFKITRNLNKKNYKIVHSFKKIYPFLQLKVEYIYTQSSLICITFIKMH